MNLSNITDTLRVLQGWYKNAVSLGRLVGENSYSDLTKETKVEPWVIVSKNCVGLDQLGDIMQGVLNYTIADYGQVVALFGKIDNIQVRRTLGAFNPNRDGSSGALLASLNLENRDSRADRFSLPMSSIPTLEASGGKAPQQSGGVSGKDIETEARNMSVGKLVDIPFTVGTDQEGKEIRVTMPIQFRLLASFVSSPSLLGILGTGTDDTGFWARFERARDGGISPAVDFLAAQDMIQEKRKLMYSDDGRMLQKILARKEANKRAALATRTPSLATLSNIFIITEDEAKELQNRMGGRTLDDEGTRNKIFHNVAASTLIVIDRSWNTVKFYQRGFAQPTELDFKQLKAQASGKGPDLMDMFKQFNMGLPLN